MPMDNMMGEHSKTLVILYHKKVREVEEVVGLPRRLTGQVNLYTTKKMH